jgi:hypothetical protein
MDLRFVFLVKKVIEINYFWMFYASCNEVHNFETCKHLGTRFINRLFVIKTKFTFPTKKSIKNS